MDIINITCAEIQTPVGFLYVILPVIINQTNNPDCEQSWLSEDGRVIADPSDPQILTDPATAVKSDRLFTSYCVNLKHEIICDSTDGSHYSHEIMFRDQLLWIFALVIIVLLIMFLIGFLLRKRKLRCFQREAQNIFENSEESNCSDSKLRCFLRAEMSVCQHEDPENKEPESGVQMKFRSDDPRSVNESESEQLNGSMCRG
ncbi:hypothetical protein ROHU_014657 [Labeo rohita]|uniref:Uncharacterized protein n=1 Tax=Labeo rohita TaxID=84645 RepID=A0A498NTD9_LABRO|nr:hypothetical protein ROHU_014657 [Labeo rohita]